MRRLSTFLISVGGVLVVGGWLNGGNDSVGLAMVFFAISVSFLGVGLLLRRLGSGRPHRVDARWREPSAGGAEWGSPSRLPGPRGRPVLALGRVETRELVGSPWFAVGVALTLLELLLFGFVWGEDLSKHWWELASGLTLFVHPFVGMMVIAGHRAVTRSRRDQCDELFTSCPLDEGGRLTGQLLPALLVLPISAGFATAMFFVSNSRPEVYGALDARVWLIFSTCGVLAAGGLVLGVSLGRWAPFFLTPVLALVAVVFIDDRILQLGGARWATDRYLASFDPGDGPDQLLLDLPVAERLLWFMGLTVVVAAIAVVGRRRWAVPALAAGAASALFAAVGVVAPMSGTADRALYLADPAAVEQCVEVATGAVPTEMCGPVEYREATRQYAIGLEAVATALPSGGNSMRFRMRIFDGVEGELPAELVAELPAGFSVNDRFRARDGEPLAFAPATHVSAIRAARYRLVAAALGLPTEADGDRPFVVAGQAHGLVVLWMGTLGLDAEARLGALRINPDDHASELFDATARGQAWPDPCWDGPAPLTWAPEDLESARRLVALPDDRVLEVVHRYWDRLDTMTSDDLLVAVDVEPVGSASRVEARPHVCPY
jgi:hypothetical protein